MPTAVEITGFHPGGVNVALGDGSVRFVGNNLQDMVRECHSDLDE
jgi:prepilin-type processing-associated H-X9-DG protein